MRERLLPAIINNEMYNDEIEYYPMSYCVEPDMVSEGMNTGKDRPRIPNHPFTTECGELIWARRCASTSAISRPTATCQRKIALAGAVLRETSVENIRPYSTAHPLSDYRGLVTLKVLCVPHFFDE